MLEKSLLERVRKVNQIILHSIDEDPNINFVTAALAGIIGANVFLVDGDGRLLNDISNQQPGCERLRAYLMKESALPDYYKIKLLLQNGAPQINKVYRLSACPLSGKEKAACTPGDIYLISVPIFSGAEQLGTILAHRHQKPFEHDDLILAEIGAAIIGMILMRLRAVQLEEEEWFRNMAGVAFESLSYSEVEAIEEIFKKLTENESIIVASKIADSLGITRSVIVNALRKFESAGIIESRSLGMKGTYIRLKNPLAMEEIAGRSAKLKAAFGETE
ncbi:MAG: GTP-sensing pleiotropic transcriptional regulator CodY [Firmicutes bacterium]|nr:GTP-sensing pleiotropic transcriptional regulator CodY [Bacillota bacterium]